jgi:hypothetical protein
MATGSVGYHLHDRERINTYLSRDAGLTWEEVAQGSHIYEYGDHGSLLVMAEDDVPTQHVLYSWDQGLNWHVLEVSDTPIEIENIIIEPSTTSQSFLVYGWEGKAGVLIYLDFSALHQRVCVGVDAPGTEASDYEEWTHSDERMEGKCYLGHKISYVRRKRDHECFNPEQFERVVNMEHCPCTEEDFECDVGYEREISEHGYSHCLPSKEFNLTIHEQDRCTDFHRVTKGYRKVVGDTCIGGSEWEATFLACPSSLLNAGFAAGKAVLILMFFLLGGLGAISSLSKTDLWDRWMDKIRIHLNQTKYSALGSFATEDSSAGTEDEEFEELNNNDFAHSAEFYDNMQSSQARMEEEEDIDYSLPPLPAMQVDSSVPFLQPPRKANE